MSNTQFELLIMPNLYDNLGNFTPPSFAPGGVCFVAV
jgi:hypothetical protein